MEEQFKYLKHCIAETKRKRKQARFPDVNEDGAEITYLNRKQKLTLGLRCGLSNTWEMQKLKVKEQPTIRKGSKSYLRYVKRNGRIEKIEVYNNGKLDVVYGAFYEGEKRYLFPFLKDGGAYPTYTYVTRFVDGRVEEEYMVDNEQIVYEKYTLIEDHKVEYEGMNYVAGGTYPVRERETGYFLSGDTLTYTCVEEYSWLDDRD